MTQRVICLDRWKEGKDLASLVRPSSKAGLCVERMKGTLSHVDGVSKHDAHNIILWNYVVN